MALEALLGFRNSDNTENINAKMVGLVPKGILKGGYVVPEPSSMQVRVKGSDDDTYVLLAFTDDGMLVRERNEEHVLSVTAGITNVLVLRAKYLESQDPVKKLEVMSLGAYHADPDVDSLIRFCSISPPAGSTAVSSDDIDMSFRDSIEGFTRKILRGVVPTQEDLPSVTGFPATAEINFLSNNFFEGSSIEISTGVVTEQFPIVAPISFKIAPPATPGLSRQLNPSQRSIVTSYWDNSGLVTVTTSASHDLTTGQAIKIFGSISPNSYSMNGGWAPIVVTSASSFTFAANTTQLGPVSFTATGGVLVRTDVFATCICKLATGVTHD